MHAFFMLLGNKLSDLKQKLNFIVIFEILMDINL